MIFLTLYYDDGEGNTGNKIFVSGSNEEITIKSKGKKEIIDKEKKKEK